MAIATIKTEKVVVRGEKCRKIVGWGDVLTEEQLPKEYTQDRVVGGWPKGNAPFFAVYRSQLSFYGPKDALKGHSVSRNTCEELDCCTFTIWKDSILPEATYQELMLWLRRAGARLGKINRRFAEENKDWHGEEVFEI